ncbi:hypothetical protein BRC74_02205 [Halobacteriales archaeon QH_7_68_42]|nr:MAG: hypothetical protein BRC74_02205 [Halobacteriales archaeon QH_7_68_42]
MNVRSKSRRGAPNVRSRRRGRPRGLWVDGGRSGTQTDADALAGTGPRNGDTRRQPAPAGTQRRRRRRRRRARPGPRRRARRPVVYPPRARAP